MKVLRGIYGLSRAVLIVVFLGVSTLTLAGYSALMTVKAAQLSAQVANAAWSQRQAVRNAVSRARAKARLRRIMVAIPVVGTGIAIAFEEREFREWQRENPEGTFGEYGCETGQTTAAVIDEVLQELPERIRPAPETILAWLPECDLADHIGQ